MDWLHPVFHPSFEQAEIEVYFLRLDRIHPYISGNKWLKLTHWLKKYDAGQFSGILTCGGPWSNHLHACAYACKQENIPMQAVVKGHTGTSNAMLDDLKAWGCDIIFSNKTQFYNDAHWKKIADQTNRLFIPMGADGVEAVQGVTDWFNALPLPCFDTTLVAVGTGSTLLGIAASRFSTKHLYGCDPGTGNMKLKQILANHTPKIAHHITLLSSGKKFGQVSESLLIFLKEWYAVTGVPLDIVYTAPLCNILLNLCHTNQLKAGSRVLLVHTGGLQGNRSLADNIP